MRRWGVSKAPRCSPRWWRWAKALRKRRRDPMLLLGGWEQPTRWWEGRVLRQMHWRGRGAGGSIVKVRWGGGSSWTHPISKRGRGTTARRGAASESSPVGKATRTRRPATPAPEGAGGRSTSSPHGGWGTTTGWGRDEAWTDPCPFPRFIVVVVTDTGTIVHIFLPPIWQGGDHRVVLSPGTDIPLLRGGEAHPPLPPLVEVGLIVQFEIFAKLPSPPLLLPSSGTVVR
jgi:hypothetical protein